MVVVVKGQKHWNFTSVSFSINAHFQEYFEEMFVQLVHTSTFTHEWTDQNESGQT